MPNLIWSCYIFIILGESFSKQFMCRICLWCRLLSFPALWGVWTIPWLSFFNRDMVWYKLSYILSFWNCPWFIIFQWYPVTVGSARQQLGTCRSMISTCPQIKLIFARGSFCMEGVCMHIISCWATTGNHLSPSIAEYNIVYQLKSLLVELGSAKVLLDIADLALSFTEIPKHIPCWKAETNRGSHQSIQS